MCSGKMSSLTCIIGSVQDLFIYLSGTRPLNLELFSLEYPEKQVYKL